MKELEILPSKENLHVFIPANPELTLCLMVDFKNCYINSFEFNVEPPPQLETRDQRLKYQKCLVKMALETQEEIFEDEEKPRDLIILSFQDSQELATDIYWNATQHHIRTRFDPEMQRGLNYFLERLIEKEQEVKRRLSEEESICGYIPLGEYTEIIPGSGQETGKV